MERDDFENTGKVGEFEERDEEDECEYHGFMRSEMEGSRGS